MQQIFPKYKYPYKQWLAAIVISPFLYILYEEVERGYGDWEILPVMFIMGIMYSLPTFVVFLLSYKVLSKLNIHYLLVRLMVTAIGIIGVNISFYLIGGTEAPYLSLSYSGGTLISACIIRKKFQTQSANLKSVSQPR